jgi:hypothetical protein
MNFIQKLREKPEPVKKQIAFWSSFGITLVIFLFWLASITGVTNKVADSLVANIADKAGTPTQSIMASVGSLFTDIKDLIFTPKKITYSAIEVEGGK